MAQPRIAKSIWFAMLAVTCIPTHSAHGESADEDKDYKGYTVSRQVSAEVFAKHLTMNGNVLRTVILLDKCEQKGLAKAVAKKEIDPQFMDSLSEPQHKEQFSGLPFGVVLATQNAANSLQTGYKMGFAAGISLAIADGNQKEEICKFAISLANDILK